MNEYDELYPLTEEEQIQRKKSFRKILILIVVIVLILYHAMLGYMAHSRFDNLQVNAGIVWGAAKAWQNAGHTLSTCSGDCKKAEFSDYIAMSGYYAVICDERGNVEYVLYSHRKIRNLNQPDQIEEYQKLKTIFYRYAVGSYPPEGNSPFT